jgi:peptide/nickel transport system permease protein
MNKKKNRKFQNGELIFGFILILIFLGIALAAPIIAPPAGDFPDIPYIIPRDGYKDIPQPPNPDHPLGTLPEQYDVFYGLIWGTRRAFLEGVSIALGRTIIGVLLGLISGYYKGMISNLIMRVTDAFMSMPSIAAAALMFALFGEAVIPALPGGGTRADPTTSFLIESRNLQIIILSLILFGWMQYTRLIHANVISEREKQYVQAAKSIGSTHRRIMFKHILPNGTKGLFVLIASDVGGMVAIVSLFYFIGLIGTSPYGLIADWGQILSVSRDWIVGTPSKPFLYWYTYLPAISAIALFTIGWSMVGDGLRDLLDPRKSMRTRKRRKSKIHSLNTINS